MMSVIIRLQGLAWSASAMDIRNFFRGLIIPQGGVHIIGGEKGDAFIAFSSDEDARQGMMRNLACLNGVPVHLLLSSKSEMQTIIDDARNRDVPGPVAVVAPPPARALPPAYSGGMGNHKQPYPSPEMNHQRPPQQPGGNYHKPPDLGQGQFPPMQKVDRGHNQMQTQMHGQQMPDRANQLGFHNDRRPDPYQQNVPPAGKQKPDSEGQNSWAQKGYEGFQPDASLGKESHHKPNQWNMGGYGSRMEGGGYQPQDGGQWQQENKQPYGGNPAAHSGHPAAAEGYGPGQQRGPPPEPYNPATAGQDAAFPQQQGGQQQQQPYPAAQPFRQEDYGAANRDSFPRSAADQPGPQGGNRRGILPRPGQLNQPPAMPEAGQMVPPPGPEDHMRFSGMDRPNMEAMPAAMQQGGQGRGRGRGPPGEPPSMDSQRFPPRRDGPPPRGGPPPEGMFPPDGPPKRGILPTPPDMANQDQQSQFSSEQFNNPEAVEQGQWLLEEGGEEPWGYQHGRGQEQLPAAREQDDSMGRGRPPFDAPEGGRPRLRRSRFDPVEERPPQRGPDGRPVERGFGGRPVDAHHEEHQMDREPDRREREHAQERGFDGPARRGHDGQPHDEWAGPDRRNQGRFGGEPEGRPFDRALGKRPGDRDVAGMGFDRGDIREDRDGERRPFKRGPEGRPKEGGPMGRVPDRRPPPGEFEGPVEDGFDRGRRFEGLHGNFPPHEGQEPMDFEFNVEDQGEPGRRGPPGRRFPGARDFGDQDRDRRDRYGRNHDRRHEGGRGNDHEPGRGRRPFEREDRLGQRLEDGRFEDLAGEERHRHRLDRDEGEPRYSDRPMRGRGRPGDTRDTDRRPMGRDREEMGSSMRNRRKDVHPEEPPRPAGKGLLGDAPGCLLPTPRPQEDPPIVQHRPEDSQRDRDRRGREDRDTGREERSGRRSDRRDRSPSREQRKSERDRDRSEHRDRSSGRDSRDSGRRGAEKSVKNDKKTEEQTKEMPESKFIHAKGFPPAYTVVEIQRFFFGCDLLFTGINIIKNARGQSTGEIYLEFPTIDHAKKAIIKNGETIFGTSVTLSFTTKQDYDEKTKSSSPTTEKEKTSPTSSSQEDKGSHIVKIKGLPPNIKREDLVNFFSSVKLVSSGKSVIMEYDDKKQATGIAYIVTASKKDFEVAMNYDGHILGSKPLQLCAGEPKEMDACVEKQDTLSIQVDQPNAQQEKAPAGPGVMGARPPLMGVAPPRRPPFYSQNMSPDAPRNGPAFEPPPHPFPRPPPPGDRPTRALGPGDRPPRGFGPGDRPPRGFGPGDRPPRGFGPGDRPPRGFRPGDRPPRGLGPGDRPPRDLELGEESPRDLEPGFCVHIQGLSMSATYSDIRTFFSGLSISHHRGVQIMHDGNGKPTGECFVELDTQEDKEEAMRRDKTSMGSQIVAVKSVAKPDMIARLRQARLSGLGPHPHEPPFPPRRGGIDAPPFMSLPSHLMNPHWFYVSCQNFPPGISVPEILEFFQDYNPVPDSLRQLYADDGTSTGNAVVGFFNREDAELVLEELNGVVCGHSMVILQPIKG